jgi:hypothetical protein
VSQPRPTIGQIVHYVSHGTPPRPDGTQAFPPACRAAIVTEVNDVPTGPDGEWLVGLCVLNPSGIFLQTGVEQDNDPVPAGGTWHWPEMV